jgi:cell division protein FtsZ
VLRLIALQAVGGIEKLKDNVDTLIIIPNDQLLAEVQDRSTSLTDAFKLADTVLLQVGLGAYAVHSGNEGQCPV